MLTIVTGLPGSGKTAFARALAARTAALHLNSDRLRRELGLMGKYRSEDKQQVYDVLFEKVEEALSIGLDVVVDGTFFKETLREPFRQLARKCHAPLRWVEVRAKEETIRQRMQTPRTDSEADFSVYEKIRDAAEPLTGSHLTLWSDTEGLDEMVSRMLNAECWAVSAATFGIQH